MHARRVIVLGQRAIGLSGLRRAAQWLALAAMLVQLVASYGHIHPEAFDALHHGTGGPVLADHHGPSRAIGDPATVDIDCQICSSMALLGSTALPDVPHVVPPLSRHLGTTTEIAALWLTPPRYLLFDTRGPPLL